MPHTFLDIDQWERKEHFHFFKKFEEPFHGICVDLNVTNLYNRAKEKQQSVFLTYVHCMLKAANQIEHFKYRITEDEKIKICKQINVSATVNREDHTFGFSYIEYAEDFKIFEVRANKEIQRIRNSSNLFPPIDNDEVIHCSALPWLKFTSLSHARTFKRKDSCPKISFGKITEIEGQKWMPISVHAHHALVDGYHVNLFVQALQNLFNNI